MEPSRLDVLAAKRGGVAAALQPGRIDKCAIRPLLKLVQLSSVSGSHTKAYSANSNQRKVWNSL